MVSNILDGNNFYLVVAEAGYIFKTRYGEDFDDVKTWGTVIFAQVVENHQTFCYKVGQTIYSKKVSQISPSPPFSEKGFYDIQDLCLHGCIIISKCWLGGKDDDYEKL